MKCKACKREIPDNSIFCNWCGERQIKERKKKEAVSVPKPRQLKSGMWNIELRAEGQSITEPTAERAIAKAKAIRAGFLEAKKKAGGITLRQAIDAYIARRPDLSPSTALNYRRMRNARFAGVMDKAIDSIVDWQSVANAEMRSVSVETVRKAVSLVRSVYKEQQLPIPNVIFPKRPKAQRPWLSPDDIRRFVPLLHGTDIEIPVLLALHSLRRSELLALKWENIDLKKRLIRVRGAVVPGEGGALVFKDTNKTVSSTRDISIRMPQLFDALNAAKQKTGAVINGNPDVLYQKINRFCRENGFPEVGFHGLRHSFASLGYKLGLTELEVMEIGGWSDFQTVHRVYLHAAASDRRDAENKIDQFFQSFYSVE